MRSTITSRGQTVVPAAIRKQFHLDPASRLEWIVEGDRVYVLPVHEDPIQAFRGQGKGGSTQRLLADRHADELRERGINSQ